MKMFGKFIGAGICTLIFASFTTAMINIFFNKNDIILGGIPRMICLLIPLYGFWAIFSKLFKRGKFNNASNTEKLPDETLNNIENLRLQTGAMKLQAIIEVATALTMQLEEDEESVSTSEIITYIETSLEHLDPSIFTFDLNPKRIQTYIEAHSESHQNLIDLLVEILEEATSFYKGKLPV